MTPFQLKNRIEELERLIEPIRSELAKHRQSLLELQSPFKRGDIIQWRNRKGRVVDILSVGSFMTWKVLNIRKDGFDGGVAMVRSYENPSLAP